MNNPIRPPLSRVFLAPLARRFVPLVGLLQAAAAALAAPPPASAPPSIQVPPGFEVVRATTVPSLVKYPMLGNFDERGRLFLA